tara:strand:+ start:148 stop:714 length:567 start_codon:yes stop_codon:yes gene_type:complete
MYGSRLDSKGEAIQENSQYTNPVAGERVKGNTIESIGLAEDKDGNIVETRANVVFKQANGATVRWTIFEAQEDWQFDSLNRNIKHLATKLMTEDEYYAGIEAGGAPTDFVSFIDKLAKLLLPKAQGKQFTMKFVYKKGYVSVPSFPNWIALPENEDTLSTNPKYDKYEKEEPTEEADIATSSVGSDVF